MSGSQNGNGALPPALITNKQAACMCSVAPATWHRMVAAGKTPKPLKLSAGCVRFRVSDLESWIEWGCPHRHEFQALMHEREA